MLIEWQDMVVVHHHTEVEAIAVVTGVAATGILLDLEGSLRGGKHHYRRPRRLFSRYSLGRQFLHDSVLAPGCSARSHHDNYHISRNST